MELKNRIVMSPMSTFLVNADGYSSSELIDYYMERARGGAGMIIIESQFAVREDENAVGIIYLDSDKCIPKLYELTEAVHSYGAKICASIGCGYGRNVPPKDGSLPVSASAVPASYDPNVICRPMTIDEIRSTVNSYTAAAERCKRAGFDAIEIHAHAGYLIDQFMSAVWNQRTDEYGGSPEKRMRFPKEILEAIRKSVGNDFPVLFRMAGDHKIPEGRGLEESIEAAKILEKAGIDAFDIDGGCYSSIDWIFPPCYFGDACMRDLGAAIKKHVSVPVLNTGNYTPDTALDALESGDIDLVMLGRPLIADPEWPNKLMEGRPEEIRPCMRCNEHCIGGILSLKSLTCGVNAQAARERRFAYTRTNAPKRVAVIGGGPAGLEAARVAADKGHAVTIFEKGGYIGGQLAAAATPPFKTLRALLAWYQLQLNKLNVDIRLNTKVAPESLELGKFDKLIIAVGASPLALPIPGIDSKKVVGVIDAHHTPSLLKGDRIVIMGGGMSGVDAAIEIAMKGKQVTIIEMRPAIAADAFFINLPTIYSTIARYPITPLCDHKVVRVTDKGVAAVNKEGREVLIEGDTIINAFGMLPNKELANSFKEKYPGARLIGDCTGIGKAGDAIRNGFFAGFAID